MGQAEHKVRRVQKERRNKNSRKQQSCERASTRAKQGPGHQSGVGIRQVCRAGASAQGKWEPGGPLGRCVGQVYGTGVG